MKNKPDAQAPASLAWRKPQEETVNYITDGKKLSDLIVKLIAKHDAFSFAVAWASWGTDVMDAVSENRDKIKDGVIGTHFYQTDPEVLGDFKNFKAVRFILQPEGVFHPKAYIFWSGKEWDALIGSANMTRGAFEKNQEITLHVTSGDGGDQQLGRKLRDQIAEWARKGTVMDDEQAKRYAAFWKRQKERRERLKGTYGGKSKKKGATPLETKIMALPWNEYFAAIKKEGNHTLEGRCELLKKARGYFAQPFAQMSEEERESIAGLKSLFDGPDWGWFGHMKTARHLWKPVRENNRYLSGALEIIPLTGTVTYEDYAAYIKKFLQAFPNGGAGMAVITRFLAMKRPDVFVKNMKKLCDDFKIAQLADGAFERYWNEIILRIQDSEWWNAPRPAGNGLEAQAWDGRAALLDALFYNP